MNTTLQQIHLNGEVIDLTEFAKEQTLIDGVNTLAGMIDQAQNTLLSRSVKYDKTTGNLTIENVELIIE